MIELQATVIDLLREQMKNDSRRHGRMADNPVDQDVKPQMGGAEGPARQVAPSAVPQPLWAEDLIPVFTAAIGGHEQLACDARTLHKFLGVRRDFSTWIMDRIDRYGFTEEDYSPNLADCSPNLGSKNGRGGHNRIDYHLTLDMAKELAMVENNPKGRRVRRYFIACERQLLSGPYSTPAQSVSPAIATPTPDPVQDCGVHDTELLAFIAVTHGRMGGSRDMREQVSLHTAKVLRLLWRRCPDEDDWYEANRHRMGRELDMYHSTVARCLRRLESWGFIEQRRARNRAESRLLRSVVEPELAGAAAFRLPGDRRQLPHNETRLQPTLASCIDMGHLASVAGSPAAALFLVQAVQWQRQASAGNGGFWFKTQHEWTAATGLSRREQESARRRLREAGVLQEVRGGVPNRLWYRIDERKLVALLRRRKAVLIEATGRLWH